MKKFIRKILLSTDITCVAAFAAGLISIVIYVVVKTNAPIIA